ncbi:MAG: hypothetical protein BroJett030_18720 [Alphaproteobacteria bacterium]|nr:MAG: hypothetical protein BroJett030_18720 [Alphaproteobacteria bacterium]
MTRHARLAAVAAGLGWLAAVAGAGAEGGHFPAILADQPPRLLSGFGFFDGPGIGKPAPGVVGYDLVTPLFSDFALKYRAVHVPEGQSARYHGTEAFDFPVGSALIKTFAFPADFRAPDRDIRLIETRVLLRQADGWQAYAYLWNEDGTEAELKLAGKRLALSFIDGNGAAVAFSYAVPSRNQCKSCHSLNGEVAPIGPTVRNLNRDFDHGDGRPRNQLTDWAERGLLAGLPAFDTVPKAADWRDETLAIDERARTWLDVNCAHCHRREGSASNSGLFLTADERSRTALGIGKRPVAAGRGAGDNEFDIVPGRPDQSILLARVESVEPGVMMPELGRSLADPAAVELLRQWILTLR